MKRLYYLTDSLDSAENISIDVHDAGITDAHFHILSRDQSGLYRRQLHSANLFHQNNVLQGCERGLLIGAGTGALLIFGSYFASYQPAVWTTLGIILFCGLAGTWLGGFIGIQQENYKIRQFHHALEAGRYLVMIDVQPDQAKRIRKIMEGFHREAHWCGDDTTLVMPY